MTHDVVVIGSGVGGLVAALLLRARGLSVLVLEAGERCGGKANVEVVDGVEFDTGPSVLTLPRIFEAVFAELGESFAERVQLVRPEPAFRYSFPSGAELDVHHELERTLDSVEAVFGAAARGEFSNYLADAARIWDAAGPHFVFGPAPDFGGMLLGGLGKLRAALSIDAFRSLQSAIEARVRSPELRMLLERYATYNGSDVRRAPATLGCIAHVELALGGYGVRGGMYELVRALVALAKERGVEFECGARVEGITIRAGRVSGVRLSADRHIAASHVVANADVAHVFGELLPAPQRLQGPAQSAPSMSAYNAVYRVPRQRPRPAHAVVFPTDYLEEFADIFDRERAPRQPAVYVCAQEIAHHRVGWETEEVLFVMANAPAKQTADRADARALGELVKSRLVERRLLAADAEPVWRRNPSDLARAFPGSRGSLYGPASNDMGAAFRRAPNELRKIPGLFLASGSAHPGGGLPLVAQSGRQAAESLLRSRGLA